MATRNNGGPSRSTNLYQLFDMGNGSFLLTPVQGNTITPTAAPVRRAKTGKGWTPSRRAAHGRKIRAARAAKKTVAPAAAAPSEGGPTLVH